MSKYASKIKLTEFSAPIQHLLDVEPTVLSSDLYDSTPFMAAGADGLPDHNTDMHWENLYRGQ